MLQTFSHMPQVSVLSVIDILVVAFVIYEFLKLVKGTRAIPMLIAVVISGCGLLDCASGRAQDD